MELVTTAVIRAHDQLTGPLNAMAAKVRSVNQGLVASSKATVRNFAAAGGAAAIGAYGLGQIIEKAQEFNKHIFGIGAADLVDEKTGNASAERGLKTMEEMAKVSIEMGRAMGFSSAKIAGAGEVFMKAGMKEGLEDILKATVTLSKADTDTSIGKIADFMHTLTIIQKPKDGEGFGDFIKRQADMVLTAADQTKLSVGSIMEGMRQFQTIGAGVGMQTEDMLAMLMIGSQRGFSATELGTAYKSNLVRSFKPSAEGQAALAMMYGKLGTQLSDYTAVAAQDPTRALSNLNRALGGGMTGRGSGDFNARIKRELFEAQKGGYSTSDAFIDRITGMYARGRGITDMKGQAELRRIVASSILTTGGDDGHFDLIKLMTDMKRAGLNPAQMASIFQGQHIARNKPLFDALVGKDGSLSEFEQRKQLLQRMKGQGLDAVETLWSRSIYGNVEAMKSAFERLWVVMANAPVVQKAVNGIEQFMNSLTQMNPTLVNAGVGALALGAAIPALRFAMAGLLSPLGLVGAAAIGLAANLNNAPDVMHAFTSSISTELAMLKASQGYTDFVAGINGISEAILKLLGKGGVSQQGAALELAYLAGQKFVGVLGEIVGAFNGAYDIMASMGLVAKRKEQPNLANGMPSYMEWDENIMGYRDTRSTVRKSMNETWDRNLAARDEVTGFFEGLRGKADALAETLNRAGQSVGAKNAEGQGIWERVMGWFSASSDRQTDAAGALSRAAGELSAAASRIQQPQVHVTTPGAPAAAPAPTQTNGQSYYGR